MADEKIEQFLIHNGLQRLVPSLKEQNIFWDDLVYLKNNPHEFQHLLPNIRDRLDLGKCLKNATADKEAQADLDPPLTGKENLISICAMYDAGKIFLARYKKEGEKRTYAPDSRNHLKQAIVEHYFRLGRGHISHYHFTEMVQVIVNELPDEEPETWYFHEKNGSQGGLLFTRYRYMQQTDRRFKSPKTVIPHQTSVKEQVEKDWHQLTEQERNACHDFSNQRSNFYVLYVKNEILISTAHFMFYETAGKLKLMNIGYSNKEEIMRAWNASFALRRFEATTGSLQFKEWEIVENYDELSELITSDFIKVHPANNQFHERIPEFMKKFSATVEGYYESFKEDPQLKDSMASAFHKNDLLSDRAIFYAFHSLPLILRQHFVSIGSKRVRVSIGENRTSFIHLIDTEAKIPETVQERRRIANELKVTIQPFIIAIGSLQEVSAYFVSFDHILHKCRTISAAVDFLFKLHTVFHMEYAKECEHVLNFIQQYFYALHYPGDKKESSVASFVSDLRRAQ